MKRGGKERGEGDPEWLRHGQLAGGREYQGERLPGSGGALDPCPHVESHPEENQTPEYAGTRRRTQGGETGALMI